MQCRKITMTISSTSKQMVITNPSKTGQLCANCQIALHTFLIYKSTWVWSVVIKTSVSPTACSTKVWFDSRASAKREAFTNDRFSERDLNIEIDALIFNIKDQLNLSNLPESREATKVNWTYSLYTLGNGSRKNKSRRFSVNNSLTLRTKSGFLFAKSIFQLFTLKVIFLKTRYTVWSSNVFELFSSFFQTLSDSG